MIGQTISHYKILEKLGEGGMGVVYKAEDTKLKRTVALKFLPKELTRDEVSRERFRREAQAAAALSHPNIITIYEIDEHEEQTYIAMECIEGQTLKEIISGAGTHGTHKSMHKDVGANGGSPADGKRIITETDRQMYQPLQIDQIIDIAIQICVGLAKAHQANIIHRDIKPQNILIDKDGRVKILDFGLAKLKGVRPLTKEAYTLGTTQYMSPEQAEGEEVDHRTDIWSLGVVLYEMITGQLPFKSEYYQAVIYSILNKEPEPLKAQWGEISGKLERIVNKALAKEPSGRYQHADDLVVDLNELKQDAKPGMSVPGKSVITVTPKKTVKRVVIAAVVILLVFFVGYWFLSKKQSQAPPDGETGGKQEITQKKKIVVFPFENLGPPEDKYFADGITEEITSRLAVVSGLGVISRTSAVQYDRKGKTLKQIAADFGVDFVLEGSVRWDRSKGGKNRVRVTPQLIRVSDDTQLWSERYDRILEDIFEIQSEIAKHVIRHLNITLSEPEKHNLEARPTKNIEAYNAYLRGIEYLRRPSYEKEPYQLGIQMFERAVALDPDFALAYAELSRAHSGFYHLGFDRTKERILQAKAAVDRAFQLQPELPEVHLVLGYYHYCCHRAYQKALEEFTIAGRGLLNESLILAVKGYIQRFQGRYPEALNTLKSAVDLSPQEANLILEYGVTNMVMRKYSRAELILERSISLAPDQVPAYIFKSVNYWSWQGDLKKSRQTCERMPRKNEPHVIYFWYLQETYERNYPAALHRLSYLSTDVMNIFTSFLPKSQLAGYIYQYMKKPGLARSNFDSARVLLEKELKKQPDDPRIHGSLGIVYAALGRKEEAVKEGKHAVKLHPVSRDGLLGPQRVEDLAHIYVILGEYDMALKELDYLLSIPYWVSIPYLQLEPKWDPLRSHPGYQKLLEKYPPGM